MSTKAPTQRKKGQKIVLPFEVKAADAKARTFEGHLSTSHLDLGDGWMRDVVRPGAFQRWMGFFKNASDPYVPLLDSHNRFSIMNAYGHLLDAEEEETDETFELELSGGEKEEIPVMRLWTKWGVLEAEEGDRVLNRLRAKAIRQMSMGYDSMREDYGTLADGSRFRNLWEVQVMEGSLVVFAMQPNATVDLATVKQLLNVAQGRELDPHERTFLEGLKDHIGTLLSTPGGPAPTQQGDADPGAPDRPTPEELKALQERVQRVLMRPLLARIEKLQADAAGSAD